MPNGASGNGAIQRIRRGSTNEMRPPRPARCAVCMLVAQYVNSCDVVEWCSKMIHSTVEPHYSLCKASCTYSVNGYVQQVPINRAERPTSVHAHHSLFPGFGRFLLFSNAQMHLLANWTVEASVNCLDTIKT